MERVTLERNRVYDGFLRLLHAVLGLSVVGLAATGWLAGESEEGAARSGVWDFHIMLGYVMTVALVLRVAWGVVGPKSARWSDLWHPRAWLGVFRGKWPQSTSWGHDPAAAAAYLGLYGLVALMAVTGLALAGLEHGTGPLATWLFDRHGLGDLFEEPHEAGAALVAAFTVVHLGALVWHERREHRPVAQAMVSGYQYRPTPGEG